jgi:hypothetical protein
MPTLMTRTTFEELKKINGCSTVSRRWSRMFGRCAMRARIRSNTAFVKWERFGTGSIGCVLRDSTAENTRARAAGR